MMENRSLYVSMTPCVSSLGLRLERCCPLSSDFRKATRVVDTTNTTPQKNRKSDTHTGTTWTCFMTRFMTREHTRNLNKL